MASAGGFLSSCPLILNAKKLKFGARSPNISWFMWGVKATRALLRRSQEQLLQTRASDKPLSNDRSLRGESSLPFTVAVVPLSHFEDPLPSGRGIKRGLCPAEAGMSIFNICNTFILLLLLLI